MTTKTVVQRSMNCCCAQAFNSMQLKQVDDAALTISRRKWGRGFQYIDEHGKVINDKSILKRLRKMVIPPMWQDVMICRWEDGHVQATGRDKKGRKQYIYHSLWEQQRQQEKFDKMLEFGQQLSAVRKQTEEHLVAEGWPKKKILALVVRVLDATGIRIGNQRYTDENESYGLTTLRRKHMEHEAGQLLFSYQGKSHQHREVSIEDDDLIAYIQQVAEQPGYEIFRYQDAAGDWQNVDSDEVNQYIQDLAGPKFYSKDFRTWVATRLAVEKYPEALAQRAKNRRQKMINILLRFVAEEIGNTPAVCKDYYVHPTVIQLIDTKELPNLNEFKSNPNVELSVAEQIVVQILKAAET